MTWYLGDEGGIYCYVNADDPVLALGALANPHLEEIARTDQGIIFRSRLRLTLDSQNRTTRHILRIG